MAQIPLPTVVRIKRKLGQETSESIIVSSKRKKWEESTDDTTEIEKVCTTIFKKLATVKTGDSVELIAKKVLQKEPKHSEELKENFKMGMNLSAKDLVQKKSKSHVAALRFKLICAKRNMEKEKEDSQMGFHLYDAFREADDKSLVPASSQLKNDAQLEVITCNGLPMESEKIEYVYDLYYTNLPVEISSWIDNICEIRKSNEIEFHRKGDSDEDTDQDPDEDDENEESNWRNEYPDEEEGDFYDDEDDYLCKMMSKSRLKDDSDESYDLDDYHDASGDFDEDGNLVHADRFEFLRESSSSDADD